MKRITGSIRIPTVEPNVDDIKIKLVIVGDTYVGKSCLIHNYLNNQYDEDYEPTVLDVYRGEKKVKSKKYVVEIHDTSGDEVHGPGRSL